MKLSKIRHLLYFSAYSTTVLLLSKPHFMRTKIYIISIAIGLCMSPNSQAQTWRHHNMAIPSGFAAKTVYGEGTSIIATNNSAFSSDAQVYYTTDSSTAYTGVSPFASFTTAETPIVKSHGILFAGTSNGIYKSHDNGHTWATTPNVTIEYSLYAHNDTLYAGVGAGTGVPQRSIDTGNTWTSIGYTGSLATSFLEYNGVLYVGSTNGLQYSSDFGATWHTVSAPSGLTAVSIVGIAAMGNSVYAACSTGVYKTSDNGGTWTNVLAQDMFSLTTVDTSLLGGTAQNGIYQSSQNGSSWTQINSGLPFTGVAAYLTVSYITYNDNYVIAAVQGDSAIYVTTLGTLGLHPSSTTNIRSIAGTTFDPKIMPNPASNEVTIQLSNSSKENVQVSIYDITGRRVKIDQYIPGNIKVDLTDLVSGSYFIQVNQGSMSTVKEVSVIK
jgi:hypothetical protein